MHQTFFLVLQAEACLLAGRMDDGLAHITEGLSFVNRHGEKYFEAELHRIRGELLQAQADEPEAEDSFRQAIGIARKQQAKSFELRATMCLCRLLQSQGKTAEAREMLSEIYGWFTEGFDTKDLKEAKALLSQLS